MHQLVLPWCDDAHNLDPSCHAHIRLEGRYVAPGFVPPPGTLPLCLRVEVGVSSNKEVKRKLTLNVEHRRGDGPPCGGGNKDAAVFGRAAEAR